MGVNQLILLGAVTFFIYFTFIQIFTVLFRLTGMSKSKSRFQVISLFTNSGYTTQEAELIVNHQLRRKLATTTMLLGYALNVTVISVLINIIMTLGNAASNDVWKFVLFFGLFFAVMIIISKIKWIDTLIQKMIRVIAIRLLYKKNENIIEVLDHYSDFTIAEISVRNVPKSLQNIPLKDNGIKTNYGIQVLAIKRKNHIQNEVFGDDIICEDDLLIVSGKLVKIKELFYIK